MQIDKHLFDRNLFQQRLNRLRPSTRAAIARRGAWVASGPRSLSRHLKPSVFELTLRIEWDKTSDQGNELSRDGHAGAETETVVAITGVAVAATRHAKVLRAVVPTPATNHAPRRPVRASIIACRQRPYVSLCIWWCTSLRVLINIQRPLSDIAAHIVKQISIFWS